MENEAAGRTPDTGHLTGGTDSLSAVAAATALAVSERTIRRAISRGDLAATKLAGVYRIAPGDLVRYRARQHPSDPRKIRRLPARPRLLPLPDPVIEAGAALPQMLTSLIARDREVALVGAALRTASDRLLTLTGPGGVGKTRLALAVAAEVGADFPDGVWFVPLAAVRDAAFVPATIAAALGVRETSGRPLVASVQSFLRERRSLLILDNLEHLLDAAPVVTELLTACPRLAVLATSRAALRLSGEHIVAVPPLALPDTAQLPPLPELTQIPAVRLFVERAAAARDDFSLTGEDAMPVAQICHRLDGLPLAIELAAARIRVLPPAALLARLDRRLPVLTTGGRDQPPRLRTLRDAIGWSYDLLGATEQRLFRRLAVFVGGCTLDAAEAVAATPTNTGGDTFEGISSLVDASLLRQETRPGAEPRFAMLETIREYAQEQLAASGEEDAARDAHAAYVLALTGRAEPHLFGADQAAWLDRLEAELPNIRAALDWLRVAGRAGEGLRLAVAPGRFWWRRDHVSEGRSWLAALLACPVAGAASPARVRALLLAGDLAAWQLENDQALVWDGEAAALARELDDDVGLAMALKALGCDAIDRGEHARAEPLLEESLARFRALGDQFQAARVQATQGTGALARGDHARAIACLDAALPVVRDHQDWRLVADTLEGLGLAALARGDEQGARRSFAESLALSTTLGDKVGIAWCLMDLASVAAFAGQSEQAARLLGASAAVRQDLGRQFQPHEQAAHDHIKNAARAMLNAATFAAAWEQGATLPLADAIAEATAVAGGTAHGSSQTVAGSAPPAGLTPRELDVLRLLAEGLSDKAIAAALFVSRRTIATHVASVFRKLDVSSRAAAATYAVRNGLA